MPRSSGGVMSLTPSDVAPAVTNTVIDPVAFNSMLLDVATEITNSLDRGGRGAATAALSMGGFKLHNLAAPLVAGDAVNLSYMNSNVQTGSMILGSIAGTADVITATFNPTQTALVNGQTILVRFGAANLTTTPTLNIDLLGAKTIFKGMGSALGIGDIPGAGYWGYLVYDALFNSSAGGWCLITPAEAPTYGMPQGRLTLLTNVPVVTTTLTGCGTTYWTPYLGNQFPGFDAAGANISMVALPELSQPLSDGTKSPSAAAASSFYDMFVWIDGATWRCTRGPAWTNGTARSTAGAIARSQGLYVNVNAITNGPGAGAGVFVGSIATNGTATLDYIFGGGGAGGVLGLFCVWNMFNRKLTKTQVVDTNSTWVCPTPGTWRQADGSFRNQVGFIVGMAEDAVEAVYESVMLGGGTTYVGAIGVGLNSLTAPSGKPCQAVATAGCQIPMTARLSKAMAGFFTIAAIEQPQSGSAGGVTFIGAGASGLTVSLMN